MAQGGAVKLSGDAAQHVNEDETNGTANTGIGPAVIRQDIMAGVQPDLLPNGTVDHNKLGAATGAGGAAVQIELRPAYGFDDGDDHGHIGRPAAGHHRIDGDLLRANRTLADGLDANNRARGQAGRIETGPNQLLGRGQNGQAVRPAALVIQIIDGDDIGQVVAWGA